MEPTAVSDGPDRIPGQAGFDGADSSNQSFEDYLGRLRTKYDLSGKIVLIHCPTFSFETFSVEVAQKKGYYAYPPAGLQCLKAALKGETGLDAEILDLNFKILERIKSRGDSETILLDDLLQEILDEYFRERHVSIVGVSAGVIVSNIYGTKNHPFLQVLNYLRQRNGQIVIAGGVIATNEWKSLLLKDHAHFVIQGEAEEKLAFFVNKIHKRELKRSLSGIHFKWNGEVHETSGEKSVVRFHWDLIETYKDIPVERYHEVGSLSPFSRMMGPEKRYGTIQLNRGCRGRCTFCGVIPFVGKGVRSYPVDSVISEITYLARERGVQHLEWLDDDLLRYRDSLIHVLKRMTEQKLNLTWAANNGLIASSLDEELLQIMIDSGCVGFRIGIESGNDEMLKRIRKPATKKSLRDAAKRLAKFPDLFVVGCYIIGFEEETYQQILDTFQLCIELDLAWSGFSTYQVVRDSTNITEEFDKNYKSISDFVPTKANSSGTISHEPGFDVRELFATSGNDVHSKEYLDEIWFAFNLLSNYINNKNLKPDGRPDRFVQWAKSLQLSHPSNAVISLFLSLGATLMGENRFSHEQWGLTESLLDKSGYWKNRFEQYMLDRIIDKRPKNASEIYRHLGNIKNEYKLLLYTESGMPIVNFGANSCL